jgi:NAD(P)-dependent dehydrogenase (short-subunit alcohol dehydrogenase family)
VKKLFDVSNKVIILTGAGGLLGTQYAEGLCQAGANIVLADLDFVRCKKQADRLKTKYNIDVLPIKLDITDKESITNLVKETIKRFSRIDVLINNAAFQEGQKERNVKFEEFTLESWNSVISVNMTGVFLCCQEVGKIMKKQKHGVILNIGSIYGLVAADQRIYGKSGLNSSIAYASTKASLINFTRYLASYWRNTGIRVNILSLGGVENNQNHEFIKRYSDKTMLGRMAKKEEYIGAVLFLTSDASSYMTGANVIIDGGWTAW